MLKRTVIIIAWLFTLMITTSCGIEIENTVSSLPSYPQEATVSRVIDGDTLILQGDIKVRLIGVDTPELKGKTEEERTLGEKAKIFTADYLDRKKVKIEYDVEKQDHYGRLLGYLYLEDGTFFNELLVKEGYAQVMTVPPNVKYADRFLAMEKQARDGNQGLWGLYDLKVEYTDQKGNPLIKGNINSKREKIYHMPNGKYYERVKPEQWFKTEKEALDAGFRKARE